MTAFVLYLQLERNFSVHSVAAYKSDLCAFVDFACKKGVYTPGEVTSDFLHQFLTHIKEDRRLSLRSQARKLAAIRHFYKYVSDVEGCGDNPALQVGAPKMPPVLFPSVLTECEVQHMIESVATDSFEGIRNKSMLMTLYSSGLRVSELIALRLSNLHFSDGFMQVWASKVIFIGETYQ